jgi:ferredoxin-NADP reductase
MEEFHIKVLSADLITRDVLQILAEKPDKAVFTPGQAAEISIDKEGWKAEKRPFTFTSLPDDKFLRFTIKTYPAHNGVTKQLLNLRKNDELIIHDIFGAITYKGEGVFIAGGAGVTPFISIFKYLESINEIGNNKLIFANKTSDDIILRYEFERLLDNNFVNILSDEVNKLFYHGYITLNFLKEHIVNINKNIYLCGPPPMMDAVEKILRVMNFDEKLLVREAL